MWAETFPIMNHAARTGPPQPGYLPVPSEEMALPTYVHGRGAGTPCRVLALAVLGRPVSEQRFAELRFRCLIALIQFGLHHY